eukprot:g125.t1
MEPKNNWAGGATTDEEKPAPYTSVPEMYLTVEKMKCMPKAQLIFHVVHLQKFIQAQHPEFKAKEEGSRTDTRPAVPTATTEKIDAVEPDPQHVPWSVLAKQSGFSYPPQGVAPKKTYSRRIVSSPMRTKKPPPSLSPYLQKLTKRPTTARGRPSQGHRKLKQVVSYDLSTPADELVVKNATAAKPVQGFRRPRRRPMSARRAKSPRPGHDGVKKDYAHIRLPQDHKKHELDLNSATAFYPTLNGNIYKMILEERSKRAKKTPKQRPGKKRKPKRGKKVAPRG